jgi:hypothetical protein
LELQKQHQEWPPGSAIPAELAHIDAAVGSSLLWLAPRTVSCRRRTTLTDCGCDC